MAETISGHRVPKSAVAITLHYMTLHYIIVVNVFK